MKSLLGVPSFYYDWIETWFVNWWDLLYNALQNKFVAVTYFEGYHRSGCGLQDNSSFSVLKSFNLNLNNGTVIKAIIFRDSKGFTKYNCSLSN